MEGWLWLIICVLSLVIAALLIKIYLLRKAVQEIESAFQDRLSTETNTLIDISGRDRHMRKLAGSVFNREIMNSKKRSPAFPTIYERPLPPYTDTWNCWNRKRKQRRRSGISP